MEASMESSEVWREIGAGGGAVCHGAETAAKCRLRELVGFAHPEVTASTRERGAAGARA